MHRCVTYCHQSGITSCLDRPKTASLYSYVYPVILKYVQKEECRRLQRIRYFKKILLPFFKRKTKKLHVETRNIRIFSFGKKKNLYLTTNFYLLPFWNTYNFCWMKYFWNKAIYTYFFKRIDTFYRELDSITFSPKSLDFTCCWNHFLTKCYFLYKDVLKSRSIPLSKEYYGTRTTKNWKCLNKLLLQNVNPEQQNKILKREYRLKL